MSGRTFLALGLWAALLSTARAEEKTCPQINLTVAVSEELVCIGTKLTIVANDNEIAGNYNGMTSFPDKQWTWKIEGITADQQEGVGSTATITPQSGGNGIIHFSLVCTSSPGAEDCDDTFTGGGGFHVVEADLGVDCNRNGAPDEGDEALEESVGGLIGVNHDDDNTNGIPDVADTGVVADENDLIAIYLNPDPAVDSGSLTLEAVSGGDKIRVWKNATKEGVPVKLPMTWYPGHGTIPKVRYVEGIKASDSLKDVQLRLTYKLDSGEHSDTNFLTVIKVDLVPDWNHDRVIDEKDRDQATVLNPYRFWINDDDDFGDVSEGDSDVPGQGGPFDNANCDDNHVNGRSDLLDFFPVWLDLNQALNVLPLGNTVQYKLKQANGDIRAVYTDLAKGQAGNFLTTEGDTYGPLFNQNSFEASTFEVTSLGVVIPGEFLDKIKGDKTKGILIVEGKGATTTPLRLEIWNDRVMISEMEIPLSLAGVEKMYRWINVRSVAGGGEDRATDTSEPDNYPESYCNGKQFIFVHGYSVHEEGARAWNAEMFKRLYQSGSLAMFTAATWRGNDGQLADWIPFVGGSTPDYYVNVEHAFETASNLVSIINASIPGSKYIAGHSLGNMVVSSAIADHGLSVNTYFMLDAAVAMEAYNPSTSDRAHMRHPDWQNYTNYHLWASEWHQLFPTNDGRGKLTWRGKFSTMSSVANYYSSTEDVLSNADGNVPAIGTERAWVNQEMRKGTTLMWIAPGNQEGGWGFNDDYEDLTVAEANALPDSTVQTNSFFGHFDDEDLYGANGSTIAQQPATHRQLLADAIPALSNPAGRNTLGSSASQGNQDLDGFKRGTHASGNWPEADDRWHHSDLKNIAYPYNSGAFDAIVNDGGLQ